MKINVRFFTEVGSDSTTMEIDELASWIKRRGFNISSIKEESKSYSKEEVIQLVSDWTDYRMSEDSKSKITFKKWFENNKKK